MRLTWAVVVLSLLLGIAAPAQQTTSAVDSLPALLTSLQNALAAQNAPAFRALLSPQIIQAERAAFEGALLTGGVTSAVLKERDREHDGTGRKVLIELLVERGGAGQIATWQIGVTGDTPAKISSLHQVSSISGLHKLSLDTSTAFTLNNFTFSATDFQITMSSGTAFAAKIADGVTALVLRGKGRMRFSPDDPVERHQLVRFSKRDALDEAIDAAYIRINPSEYHTRISDGSLTPATPSSGDIGRARAIFDQWSPRSFNVALGDLSSELWTLLPTEGDALADVLTQRLKWLTYSRSGNLSEDVSLFNRETRRNISVYASPAKIATRGRFYSDDDGRKFDVEHYDINARFNPEKLLISGTTTMRLKVLSDADTIMLRLAEPLNVTSLSGLGYGRLLHLRVTSQDSVLVSFPETQRADKVITLTIGYAGKLAPQSLSREAAEVQGQERRYQENEFPPEPNYTYSNNSYWYPQSLVNDYATARIRLTVPQDFQAVGSGTLVDETVDGIERTATFAADTPARYLSTVISRFVPIPRSSFTLPNGKTLTIDARSNPRQVGSTKTLSARAAEIMKFYASIAGDVPYPSFTLLSLESELPGGHSPAYFAALNQPMPTTVFAWHNDPIAFDDQFPNFYLAHEIAHQWWGQAIGYKTYHDQWLSEGLAQYFAYRYAGTDRGLAVQRNILDRMRQSVRRYADSGPISIGYRLGHAVGDGANFRAIVYNKSVVVLDMLRQLIGDDAFNAGLRRFYQTWKYQKAGSDDLRQAFEAEAKEPLNRFFDRWIFASGSPSLKLSTAVDPSGQSVLLRVEQTGEIYDMPVQVAIGYDDRPTEYVTVLLRGPQAEQRVALKGKVRPDSIRLIPGL